MIDLIKKAIEVEPLGSFALALSLFAFGFCLVHMITAYREYRRYK